MLRYFGTDGVRGVAGKELSAELAFQLSRAAGKAFQPKRALLAQDTRLSGPALAAACTAGLAETGCDVSLVGVLPSPAVSHFVPRFEFGLGIVVSASHNPPEDNGIKFYGPEGLKLSPKDEERVEALLDGSAGGSSLGKVEQWDEAEERYLAFLLQSVPRASLLGTRIVLDCAHGATTSVAPRVFEALGASLVLIGAEPDGARINTTGAAVIQTLTAVVRSQGADLGIAFDGDGDRVLFVDGRGEVVEGDQLMAALAPWLWGWGEISSRAVVFTVLGNLGAERYLVERGFRVVRVPVGDRNVCWEMREQGIELGGEPSGHIVFSRFTATGDGILTAIYVLSALTRAQLDLAAFVAPVPMYPQVRADVPVSNRDGIMESSGVALAIQEGRALLGGTGRLVVRPSGTQPLIRIMAEGEDEGLLRRAVERVEAALVEPTRSQS